MSDPEQHNIKPLDENSRRQIYIGWGSALVCVALAIFVGYFVGGVLVPTLLLSIGVVVALRGHKPSWFIKHTDAQIILNIPEKNIPSWKAWILASLLIVGFSVGASQIINRWYRPQVRIEPTSVIFSDRLFSLQDSYTFRMSNTSDHDVYRVMFKFRISDKTLSCGDFSVHLKDTSRRPLGDVEVGAQHFADVSGFAGRDASGNPLFILYVNRLAPRDWREVVITRKKSGIGDTTLTAQVGSFSVEPTPISTKGIQTLECMKPDEAYTSDHAIFFMADTTKDADQGTGETPEYKATIKSVIFMGHTESQLSVFARCNLENTSGPPSSLREWSISLQFPGGSKIKGITTSPESDVMIPSPIKAHEKVLFKLTDYLPTRTARSILAGESLEGWVWAKFDRLGRNDLSEAIVTVHCLDVVSGNRYSLKFTHN